MADGILDQVALGSAPTPQGVDDKKALKKQEHDAMKHAFIKRMTEDPAFAQALKTRSGDLEVLNTLGFGTSGSIILDKNNSKGDKRALVSTSAIVGYKFKNVSQAPIEYTTKDWTYDEASGKYVDTTVTKVAQPGDVFDLTREFTTRLLANPEFSFAVANGKLCASSRKDKGDLQSKLESYYFSFSDKREVNSDEVKLKVDDNGTVKPEYVATFGFLNNPKEDKVRMSGGGSKYTTADLEAQKIYSLINGEANLN